jgi:hypothetical protein
LLRRRRVSWRRPPPIAVIAAPYAGSPSVTTSLVRPCFFRIRFRNFSAGALSRLDVTKIRLSVVLRRRRHIFGWSCCVRWRPLHRRTRGEPHRLRRRRRSTAKNPAACARPRDVASRHWLGGYELKRHPAMNRLRATAGKRNETGLRSVTAHRAGGGAARDQCKQPNPTPNQCLMLRLPVNNHAPHG